MILRFVVTFPLLLFLRVTAFAIYFTRYVTLPLPVVTLLRVRLLLFYVVVVTVTVLLFVVVVITVVVITQFGYVRLTFTLIWLPRLRLLVTFTVYVSLLRLRYAVTHLRLVVALDGYTHRLLVTLVGFTRLRLPTLHLPARFTLLPLRSLRLVTFTFYHVTHYVYVVLRTICHTFTRYRLRLRLVGLRFAAVVVYILGCYVGCVAFLLRCRFVTYVTVATRLLRSRLVVAGSRCLTIYVLRSRFPVPGYTLRLRSRFPFTHVPVTVTDVPTLLRCYVETTTRRWLFTRCLVWLHFTLDCCTFARLPFCLPFTPGFTVPVAVTVCGYVTFYPRLRLRFTVWFVTFTRICYVGYVWLVTLPRLVTLLLPRLVTFVTFYAFATLRYVCGYVTFTFNGWVTLLPAGLRSTRVRSFTTVHRTLRLLRLRACVHG